jgi:hypothetical protein
MKVSRNLFSLAAASLLLGASAFAAPTKGTLKLFESVSVQGQQLAPGQYTVEWNGEGPNVELNITNTNGKQAVASIPARVVPVGAKNPASGYTSAKQGDGSTALTDVFFQGKAYELQIGQQSATTAPQAGTSGSNQ